MDAREKAIELIKLYYKLSTKLELSFFIKKVCEYYDLIKSQKLNDDDIKFLMFMASKSGVPQYFDLLSKYNSTKLDVINLNSLKTILSDMNLYQPSGVQVHKYQLEILQRFQKNDTNRFLLSAPTSFGKTFLVYEIIKKMKYKNIVLVFPTISLITENYQKIINTKFDLHYKIHTLSDTAFNKEENNIFVFTPERYLSFLLRNKNCTFDFAFVDEIYKIDNKFDENLDTIDERNLSYRFAIYFICNNSKDVFLCGPYFSNLNSSFQNFMEDNHFTFLNYNDYELVSKNEYILRNGVNNLKAGILKIRKSESIPKRLALLLNFLFYKNNSGNTLIYCETKFRTRQIAKSLLKNVENIEKWTLNFNNKDHYLFDIFINHLEDKFGDDWIITESLKKGIGVHNSLIPKYIQKEMINLFNKGLIKILICTTTITEGVNTVAKNIIITSHCVGENNLKKFDVKNIMGRAGRLNIHFTGNVFILDDEIENIMQQKDMSIQHKNYDLLSPKDEMDYYITSDEYLVDNDKEKKTLLEKKILELGINVEVIKSYPTISQTEKISLYEKILKLSEEEIKSIENFYLASQNNKLQFNWNDLNIILNIILPIVSEGELKDLIIKKCKTDSCSNISILIPFLNTFITSGIAGLIRLKENSTSSKDKIIDDCMNLVNNIFKYKLSKYIGLFDDLYRTFCSSKYSIKFEELPTLKKFLYKLEYNATNEIARKVSDYGVPSNVINAFEENFISLSNLDDYEKYIYNKAKESLKD